MELFPIYIYFWFFANISVCLAAEEPPAAESESVAARLHHRQAHQHLIHTLYI